ncbi:MAG TPA: hypothetical protein VG733_04220 [Chthoniobacteraceae bacterium]|nr:hypothetical protein [Chthoniobacteraceae bacterium]
MQTAPARKTSFFLSKETLRIAVLALAAVLIWCAVEDRWTAEAWNTPVEYFKDPGAMDILSVLASIKAASEGNYTPLALKSNPRLGAPYGASWNDYPNNEQFQLFFTGLLADSIGLMAAANAAMLLLFVLAAVAFYFVCRQFRCAWQWAFAMALVFAFAPFLFAHGQHHMTIIAVWHIPLCLLVCQWVSTGEGLRWKGWRFWFAAGVAIFAAVQNVYYAGMFLQLLALGCVLQLLRGRWRAALPPMAVGALVMATFLAMNVNTFVYHHKYGPNSVAVTRVYEELEWTGMKLIDFFMPWQHRIGAFQKWSEWYYGHAYVHGETPPATYLGIVGIAALAWFLARVLRRSVFARPARPVPLAMLQFAWIFAFSMVGGFNGLLGAVGFILFRATARYSIFLLCILLLFLARRLSCMTAKSPALAGGLALAVVALALWDQTPPWKSAQDVQATAALVNSDRKFAEGMEKHLPESALVFEMPIMDYPENKGTKVLSYEHFRPYLFTQTLHFSFGGEKGRPRADWEHWLDNLPPKDFAMELERYGFSAVYVNLRGVDQPWVEGLIDYARSEGGSGMISDEPGQLCVFLKPDPHPASPLDSPPVKR